MNAKKYFIGLFALFVLASLACIDTVTNQAATNQAAGREDMRTVSSLWSDVPQMDGLTASQMDMPTPLKLIIRTLLGNLGRLNPQGQDQTTGTIDWIVFTTDKSPQDVQNFYTNERMTANGWDASENSTCLNGSEQGFPQVGVFCVFVKTQDGKGVQLAILTAQDDQTKKNNVFFLRLEESPTPVPSP